MLCCIRSFTDAYSGQDAIGRLEFSLHLLPQTLIGSMAEELAADKSISLAKWGEQRPDLLQPPTEQPLH